MHPHINYIKLLPMLKILKPGFYSTLQDTGRFDFRDKGVPVSGAMDLYSSKFANALLGNDADSAVIEMTMVGGVFQFLESTYITVSGANMSPQLNGISFQQNTVISVKSGDILCFQRAENGFRTYLAVKGGFILKSILGSQSQYAPITALGHLKKEQMLQYPIYNAEVAMSNAQYNHSFLTNHNLDVFEGPEFNTLSEYQKALILTSDFKVSKYNNRMAYQLESTIENEIQPILTSPVLSGTVQLTPKGHIIILMRDAQTTGGYPRILQLTEHAVNILGQKTTGNIIKFRLKAF